MSRAAVLGRPIAHSLSPVMHRAAYAALGLDWTYDAVDCGVDDLAAVLGARADSAGFSCTMPLKHAIVAAANTLAPRVVEIGSANTLLPATGGWRADNTDVDGVLGALREAGVTPTEVTVLGAGGTAQAVVAALAELGVPACTVLLRDRGRVDALAGTAERVGVRLRLGDLDDGTALAAGLVVSTLPAGAADDLAERRWRPDQAVLDVVYAGWPTPLAAAAGRGGATVVSGALMLLHQAARQVELMTGRDAPVEAMRAALRTAAPTSGL